MKTYLIQRKIIGILDFCIWHDLYKGEYSFAKTVKEMKLWCEKTKRQAVIIE